MHFHSYKKEMYPLFMALFTFAVLRHAREHRMSMFIIIGTWRGHRSRGLNRGGTRLRGGDELRLVRWNCA